MVCWPMRSRTQHIIDFHEAGFARLRGTWPEALDGAAAWSFLHNGSLYVHTDLQFHGFGEETVRGGRFGLYVGIGGRVLFSDFLNLGFRVPFGFVYLFPRVRYYL